MAIVNNGTKVLDRIDEVDEIEQLLKTATSVTSVTVSSEMEVLSIYSAIGVDLIENRFWGITPDVITRFHRVISQWN